jgi:anti-sigma factor RsiW
VSERAPTCHEVIEILTDYLEDALPPEERRRVEQHLATCDGCTAYLETLRETIRLSGMVREEQIPEEQKQQLLDAFRDWTRTRRPEA